MCDCAGNSHGFQLGEFNIPMDKRQPYDFDTRIHLLARGPGIKPGTTWAQPATQVDMAPTFLGIAGLPKPATMDGHSILPLLVPTTEELPIPHSVATHLSSLGDADDYAASWRTAAFIEYISIQCHLQRGLRERLSVTNRLARQVLLRCG